MRNSKLFRASPGRTIAVGLFAGAVSFFPTTTQAQSLFDMLFGAGQKQSRPAPRYRAPAQSSSSNYNVDRRNRRYVLPSRRNGIWSGDLRSDSRKNGFGDRRLRRGKRSGGFATLCVRSCDGYYFPINFNVGRGRFAGDAKSCRSQCGDEAKLYYKASHASPKTMRDLRGRPYAKTKTAFLFRKKRIKGCGCRAVPWARSEFYRHRLYALNEPRERKLARLEGDLDFLAGVTKKRKSVVLAEAKAAAAEKAKAAVRDANENGDSISDEITGGENVSAAGADQPFKVTASASVGVAIAASQKAVNIAVKASRAEELAIAGVARSGRRPSAVASRWRQTYRSKRSTRLNLSAKRSGYRRSRAVQVAKYGRNVPRQRRRAVPRRQYVNRRAPQTHTNKTFWGGSAKPKYRWPGD